MRVLHVPYTYFPDPPGGTEIYVAALCAELAALGIESRVAVPASQALQYSHDGVAVHRFATMAEAGIDQAWKGVDPFAAEQFGQVLDDYGPDMVHLHARTAAVSSALAGRAQRHGAKVLLTYHSPTVSCARGTMLHGGSEPCDGELRSARCIRCALGGLGVPAPLAALAASPMGVAVSRLGRGRLRVPALIERAAIDFREMLDTVDHVVAVCDWVREALLRNGAAPERLILVRQGVARSVTGPPPRLAREAGGPLRIAYYGRLDPAKGVGLLIDAVRAAPGASVGLDLYLIDQAGDEARTELTARSASDGRIAVKPPLAPPQVVHSMAGYDLVAVPSRGMETGPLVVLEAWAAGVPVLGARRGGIAELVRDGIDGLLIPPGDVGAWSEAIARLAAAPELVERLRGNIRPPRTMAQVAAEMAEVYRRVLAGSEQARVGSLDRKCDAEAVAR